MYRKRMEGRTPAALAALGLALGLALVSPPAPQAAPAREEEQELVVYTYDSFVSEWGTGPRVVPLFEKLHGVKVRLVSAGDAGQVLNRAILEKDRPQADVLLGLDNNLLARARDEGVLQPYRSPALERVPAERVFDPDHLVTPFDYGYFAFIHDTQALPDPPASLEELTDPRLRGRIILEDPRTSSPGLGFLLWTIAVYGDGWQDYWRRLLPNVLTIAEGWDTAYGLFTSGEAPLVLSYTTSPAYHVESEKTTRFRSLLFPEGHYLQVEGLGVVKGAPHPELARRFVDFALSEEFQREIPLTNWMYPVLPDLPLPESYSWAPRPQKSLSLDPALIGREQQGWLDAWARLAARPGGQ